MDGSHRGVPKLEETMKKYGKSFEYKIYAGAPHAFNNDTSPQSYREDAAKEAWNRTLEFFKRHLPQIQGEAWQKR